MADTDDFVFEFELKGEKEVNIAIDDLRAAIKDLTALIQEMNKAGSSGLTDEEKKLRLEERRLNMKIKERREDRLQQSVNIRKENLTEKKKTNEIKNKRLELGLSKTKAVVDKAQKALEREKTQLQKAQTQLETAQVNKEAAALRLETQKTKELKKQNASLASYIGKLLTLGVLLKGMQKLIEASGQIRGYNLAATSTGLNATDIKQFGYATKVFGGSEQQATSAVMNLGSRLQAAKRGDDTSLFQALGRAGIGFGVDDLTSPFKLMSTVSREMKKWTSPEDIKQGMDILREIFDEPTLRLLKDGYEKNIEAAKEFVMVRPEDERAAEQLYNDIKNLQSVMREFWQLMVAGFGDVSISTFQEFSKAIRDTSDAIRILGKGIGYIVNSFSWVIGKVYGAAEAFGEAIAPAYDFKLSSLKNHPVNLNPFSFNLFKNVPSIGNVPTSFPSNVMTTNNMTGGTVNYTSNMTVNVSSVEEGNTFAQQNKQGDISVMEKMSGVLGVPFRRSLNNNTMGGG